jgi:hypothetical protein
MKNNNSKKYIFILSFICNLFLFAEVFDGYTLFTPLVIAEETSTTFLINNNYEALNTWTHNRGPASMPYLLADGSILYPFRVEAPTMEAGGVGGGIQKQSWDGEIMWEYIFSDEQYQHHHDIEPLPSGNVLIIVWEKKTAQEAYDLGRESITNPLNQMWSTAILELDPETGLIVWEWHLWDHLVQDNYPEIENYGSIAEHPELFNINCGEVGGNVGGPQSANADWMHINAINYNPILDQIVISSRTQNEIYIIDHSTTTEESATHSGGNSGKGGDFLYRWGNPGNYNHGDETDQILNSQHGLNWIPEGYPGEGNLILFNNFHSEGASAVLEIITPTNEEGNYNLNSDGVYGPDSWLWGYFGDIITPMQGGAFRLSNGNTLITQTHTARIIEVDFQGEIVWDFTYESDISSHWIARAQKYPIDYLMNSFIPGDVNGDGIINILDVVSTVNIVLGLTPWIDAADYNDDAIINVLDIVSIVNIILAN